MAVSRSTPSGVAAYVGRLPAKADFTALAPILCAGVTTYKGIKETEVRRASGSSSPVLEDSVTSPCSMQRRWGCTSLRSTSQRRSSHLARALGADVAVEREGTGCRGAGDEATLTEARTACW